MPPRCRIASVTRALSKAVAIASPLAWAALAILVASSPVAGSPARVETPTAGAEVVIGSLVEVSWRALPPQAKEMELYLSLDGGATYPLRLTPQLPPGLDRLRWCVPNLPTPAARLRMRVGIPGRGEVDAEPSPVFRIVAEGQVTAEPVVLRGGELWIGRGTDSLPRAPASLGDAGHEVRASLSSSLAGEAPRLPRFSAEITEVFSPPLGDGVGEAGVGVHPPPPGETTPLPLRR